ncbi:hypothetical protein FSARC_14288 [Fusarium sarcochroum]|uniref:Uncharacterized protein n=1 Tax=Fusarium sarcochroum TaxID=1208366 RepID=A0A8H4SUR6_9HYPO|nr:hypothetical protein FSARC_14288 [Fusarium sarcochroum]
MPSPRVNLGPLTTKFKYPDRCTAPVIACSACEKAWLAQTCGDNKDNTQGVLDDTDCWPPRASSIDGGNAVNGWGFYSPGFECPSGYEPACSATGTETGDFNFQFSIQDDETVTGCCPSGYTCAQPGGPQTCISVASRGSLQVASCSTHKTLLDWLTFPETVIETVSETIGPETRTRTLEGVTLNAPMFQINRRAKDIPSSTELTAATETSTSESTDSASTGGLSTGAQAGIGAGVGVAGLAIIGAAFYLWRRRRRAAPVSDLGTEEPKPAGELPAETKYSPPQYHPVELDGAHPRHEM